MRKKLTIALVAVGLAGLGIPDCPAQTSDVAVVVNEANHVTDLTKSELRRILAGEKHTWSGGQPIKLFIRAPEAPERATFLKLLGNSESEYKHYWTAEVFRGEAQSEPIALFSNGMQKEAVAAFPGAVALIDIHDVKPGMRVVKLDGRMPGEKGYPLN